MKISFRITWLFTMLIALNSFAQTNVEKKLIATLGPGETLANDENCFLLEQSPETISFVTVVKSGNEKEYYCYGKDGKKTGPVKSPDASYWAARKPVETCVPNETNLAGMEKYLDMSDGSITYLGRKYGPYGMLVLYNGSADDKYIYAIALTIDKKIVFFDNTGRKTEITGMPEQIIISPDGKTAYVKVKGTMNPFDPEAAQKMINDTEEINNPKVFLTGIDGKKYGPYPSSSFDDTWFTPSGQWIIFANSEIYVDGKFLFKVDGYVSPCDLWIGKNGKDYAWANYEKLTFSDGSTFTAPLEIQYTEAGSKAYLKWLTLEQGKDLVLYKKPF